MGSVRTGHVKEVKRSNEVRVYVGRSTSLKRAETFGIDLDFSEFGNPYIMQGESKRQQVIDMYKTVIDRVKTTKRFQGFLRITKNLMDQGKDVVLLCWCHPKTCHADVLVNEVNNYIRKETECHEMK